ncbi:HTH-type transcriptional activator RhaR [Vibrio stylophorae]|uniref:HTH-type transcriptional activator RhaR n=1 Tax=Vibrio stylophorae TaxID=659351 RepID=A0ABN8DTN3_9VIBR|nr:AraC family transcriptional regulator [Vibrio stylophorae]CAH0533688.1 HTH-type transcriptional activator RhaR [Vibrio stylophorae]
MKPNIETISSADDFRWSMKDYRLVEGHYEINCGWHYHQEYELVLYYDPRCAYRGKLFVGDHIMDMGGSQLILLGPGVPHMVTASTDLYRSDVVHQKILWFSPRWLEQCGRVIPELRTVEQMLKRSNRGLCFGAQTIERVASLLENFANVSPARQFAHFIQLLLLLTEDKEAKPLSVRSHEYRLQDEPDAVVARVEQARRYIAKNYQNPIQLKELAKALHMSESSVYRLFERHFEESFVEHLRLYRLGKACELLATTNRAIALIAEDVGFNNLSNFNRQFKEVKKMTPSHFRKLLSE